MFIRKSLLIFLLASCSNLQIGDNLNFDNSFTNNERFLLGSCLRDVNEHCETIPDPVQLEYHLPNNFCISVDREYEKFLEKLTERFPHEKEGIKKFYGTCEKVFNCLDSMPLL